MLLSIRFQVGNGVVEDQDIELEQKKGCRARRPSGHACIRGSEYKLPPLSDELARW